MASVKVAVRVRPFNERELSMDCTCIIHMQDNKTSIVNQHQTLSHMTPKEFVYDASYWSFDHTDSHYVSQLDVYNDLGKMTLDSAFDGYNACVCAYGQTGSGKSFSMMGLADSDQLQGLIPRISKNLFCTINSDQCQQTTYRCEVSYLEIYNEKVRDLLRSKDKGLSENLKVREHPKTGVYVQDLSQHTVVNYDDVDELLTRGNHNRTVASTQMNEASSRSHAIFTVKFCQAKMVDNFPSETISKINLVDLAGSERADSTGATGIRLKEGGNINKSLLTFINVISTLADMSAEQTKKQYVPYRDSVLTWLLKDSLGGNSKTVILAAISPADVNYAETMSTLRYANRAKNIINKPTVNEDPNMKLIRELRAEVGRLKLLLESSGISAERALLQVQSEEKLVEEIGLGESRLNDLTNEWKCKWSKYHSIFEEFEGLELSKNTSGGLTMQSTKTSYLLCFDLVDCDLSLFPLKDGINIFHGLIPNEDEIFQFDASNKIYLNDSEISRNFCYIKYSYGRSTITLVSKSQTGKCLLNGTDLSKETEFTKEIYTNDFILLGKRYVFQYKDSDSPQNQNSLSDFFRNFFGVEIADGNENLEQEKAELKEKLKQSDFIIEEQRRQIQSMNEQIKLDQSEIKQIKELNFKNFSPNLLSPATTSLNSINLYESEPENKESERQHEILSKEMDERETMHNMLEKFEREEKLLSDCLKNLAKSQESQLKSLLFELQNLRLREQELQQEFRREKAKKEEMIKNLEQKRDNKLSELNTSREKILNNKQLQELKVKMSQLSNCELDLAETIEELEESLKDDRSQLDRLNTQLDIKKMYELNDGNKIKFDELIQMESENLKRAKNELENVKKSKFDSYELIEKELKKAEQKLIEEFEQNNESMKAINAELANIAEKENQLRSFLTNCLYENDEEKCLVENELTDLEEVKEQFEEKLNELRSNFKKDFEEQMQQEYIGLDELKKHDMEEISHDEERINLLYESSTKYLMDLISNLNQQISVKSNEMKSLQAQSDSQNKKMNQLLAELEIMENKRLMEESNIFLKEIQIANEAKADFDKLMSQNAKLELFYKKKLDETASKKESIKPKICQIVGNYRGNQLFEADFNPKIPESRKSSHSNELMDSTRLISAEIGANSHEEVDGLMVRKIRREIQEPRFETHLCKALSIQVEINESFLFGKKSWDEHYEYLIELRVNEEYWYIFRRYSKIRQLHEQMCLLYPSLNRLVFPMRLVFNLMDNKQRLLERQSQLEHYLNCFLEILLNDPNCPLCLENFVHDRQVSNSLSMTSLNSSLYSSSIVSTNSNGHIATGISRSVLCSFCPFFEQNTHDLNNANKLNIKQKHL